jgi:hypothetical protein
MLTRVALPTALLQCCCRQVLPSISLSSALLQSSSLAAAVAELHAHPNAALAAAARHVSHAWAVATGQAAPAGIGSRQRSGSGGVAAAQQYAAPGGLIQCGGSSGKALSAGYKRRVSLAVKRQLEDMELVGDLKRHNGTAAAAAGGGMNSTAAGPGSKADAASKASVLSSDLKKPSRRAGLQPAPGTAAAGAGSHASQGQASTAQASRWAPHGWLLHSLRELHGKLSALNGQRGWLLSQGCSADLRCWVSLLLLQSPVWSADCQNGQAQQLQCDPYVCTSGVSCTTCMPCC